MAWLVAPGDGRPGGHRRLRQGRSRPGRAPGARAADNGAAPGPSRRPVTGRLVEHVRSLGVEPPAAKAPAGPPPTGDNERFGQTLLRYLDQQPLADSIAEPPGDGSTASTTPCNTQRPHQGLPGRITGQQAWDATEVARAPRPGHDTDPITPGGEPARDAPAGRRPPHRRRPIAPSGERELTITRNGTVHIGGIAFLVRRALAGHRTTAIWDATTITFAHAHGRHPDPATTGRPKASPTSPTTRPTPPTNAPGPRPQQAPTVTEVLTHRTSPMS